MMKYEIQNIENQIGVKLEELPFLQVEGKRRKWTFIDCRTYEDPEGYWHVYPIGFSKNYVYIIDPRTGAVKGHGIPQDGNYPGHRSEGYIIEDPRKNNPQSIDDLKLTRRFREVMRAREKIKEK